MFNGIQKQVIKLMKQIFVNFTETYFRRNFASINDGCGHLISFIYLILYIGQYKLRYQTLFGRRVLE